MQKEPGSKKEPAAPHVCCGGKNKSKEHDHGHDDGHGHCGHHQDAAALHQPSGSGKCCQSKS